MKQVCDCGLPLYGCRRCPEHGGKRDWLQRLWWRWLWSDRKARDPFTGFLVREYRRLTDDT